MEKGYIEQYLVDKGAMEEIVGILELEVMVAKKVK